MVAGNITQGMHGLELVDAVVGVDLTKLRGHVRQYLQLRVDTIDDAKAKAFAPDGAEFSILIDGSEVMVAVASVLIGNYVNSVLLGTRDVIARKGAHPMRYVFVREGSSMGDWDVLQLVGYGGYGARDHNILGKINQFVEAAPPFPPSR